MSNLQPISDSIKNGTNNPTDNNQTPNPPNPSIPSSQANPPETQATKTNPKPKPKNTRAHAKQQAKGLNPNAPSEANTNIPNVAKEMIAALGTETQIISVNEANKADTIEQARRAKIALDKAVKARDEGNEERAEIYYTIYHSLLPNKRDEKKSAIDPKHPPNGPDQPIIIDPSFSSTIPQKRSEHDGVTTEVRNLKFRWGVSNNHTDGGFTPYFHKNILELKGYIPLTIFNKEWQARALAWHAENRCKVSDEEKGLKYWGYKVPNEYEMSFSDWTLNYTVFYETMLYSYKFDTLDAWILLHKANCDKIQRKDGFMTALRYNIKVRTNAWQFKPIVDGEEFVSDFSKMKPETYKEAYGEARNNDELQFKTTNPYEIGGPREKWDARQEPDRQRTFKAFPTQKLHDTRLLPPRPTTSRLAPTRRYQPDQPRIGTRETPDIRGTTSTQTTTGAATDKEADRENSKFFLYGF
ncbi:hypothetical protein Pst134EA_025671 [Puccinia striiformis f. sp. tritici]|uniref:hypothetical protein n=1 Tax=Puccinia striiformis f. sp. tritici TaxID=168172 RepID=UPI0020080CD2|nr:hypothetical protein Pst134EA_025671 [Puccinia striiformis f. sp. tritici]KAH9451732.1 hypothetical protein Pst134EA_025671 [Puccinia striiformis f. sp. tritici]